MMGRRKNKTRPRREEAGRKKARITVNTSLMSCDHADKLRLRQMSPIVIQCRFHTFLILSLCLLSSSTEHITAVSPAVRLHFYSAPRDYVEQNYLTWKTWKRWEWSKNLTNLLSWPTALTSNTWRYDYSESE